MTHRTLAQILDTAYHESNNGSTVALNEFIAAVNEDPAFLDEAKDKAQQLRPLEQRDHISKVYRQFINRAVEAVTNG